MTGRPPTDLERLFPGNGEMAKRMRRLDWARTPLGPVERWEPSLRSVVRMLLASKAQILLSWGDDYVTLYNDPYIPVFGSKHPSALGQPVREAWSEIWLSGLKDLFDGVVTSGEAFWATDRPFFIERHRYVEETYFDVSYDPVRDDDDRVRGVFCIVTETTARVVGARRLTTLRDLGRITEAESVADVYHAAADVLLQNATDVPFALFYGAGAEGGPMRLLASSGIDPGSPAASAEAWPLGDELVVLECDALAAFGELRAGPWPEPIRQVAVVPVTPGGQAPEGWLVAGISPRRRFDDDYGIFLGLVASNVAAAVTTVRRTEDERRRAEMLAELDRAKTDFFSNVSHEFRTPLTLMLGPLEEAKDAPDVPPDRRESLEAAHRNSLRLLRLVNTLLDFSRIEADRAEASFEPIDVATFTRELASAFRSAVDKAGLSLEVRCEEPSASVYVDRDMWEKIVLNLISNAVKFTRDGGITITLVERGDDVELTVRDTGVGIPADELPHVFERFHRVRGTEGRTHEGTGIGLALVTELVRLHGGDVRVESEVGVGSAFTVRIPTGSAHLPRDRIGGKRTRASTALGAAPFVEEALRWLPDAGGARAEPAEGESGSGVTTTGARILVADDNADMRGYVVRLLARHWKVEAVGDGEAALAAIRRARPDLVLSDVMMPRLDGIALTRAIRADPELASLPLILVSARAGEEARIEGVDAQADDYLTKPFSARELVARVNVHLELQRVRRETEAAIRASEQRFRTFVTASADAVYRMSPDWSEMRHPVGRDFIADTHEASRSWLDKYIHPDDQADVMEVIRQAIRTKSPFELVHRVRRVDGTLGWTGSRAVPVLDDRGEIVEWFGTASDLTERKRAEEDIRRRGTQFATLIGEAPVGVYLVDCDFQIREVNPVARPLFARVGDPIGRNLDDVVRELWPREHADEVMRRFRHTLATGEPHHAPEVRGERSGKVFDWQINRIPLPDGRVGVVCYFRDISEQVEARERLVASEERARDARVEAEAANRAKDDFLATVSHELRSPLQGILGWLTLLKRGQLDAAQTARALEAVERSVRLQAQLVHDIMDISRIVAGKVELERTPLDLAAVLRATAEEFAPAAVAKKVELVSDLDRSNLVMGDLERLHQVFSNLLSNALKFTPEGGRVTLACRHEGDDVVATVRDTGDGIGAEFLPRLFDRFTQADTSSTRRYGGLGLGLAIVRNLVELHGGTVSAESDGVGRGAAFSVRLPVALAAGGVRPPAAEPPLEPPRLTGVDILLVEDDRDSLDAMTLSLEAVGAVVRPATSARDAWSAFTDRPPDVVVSDLSMPTEDGYALLRRIRRAGGSVPAVALTGFTRPEDRARVLAAGFAAHVAKPIDPDELVKVLVHVLAPPPAAGVG